MVHLCASWPVLAYRIGTPPASVGAVLEGDGEPDGDEDGDALALGPVDPVVRLGEADGLALALVRDAPGDGLLPGCPLAVFDPVPCELLARAPGWVPAAEADADRLAVPPEPASRADAAAGVEPNGCSVIAPMATSATAAVAAAAMMRVRLLTVGLTRRGVVASGGRSSVNGVVWTACSGSGHMSAAGVQPAGCVA
jgi:hypothetical protein